MAETRESLTVTKRGKPVATLVPATTTDGHASLRGSARVKGNIVGPVLDRWDADR